MSKTKVAQPPTEEKSKPAPLTLADLTIKWTDGEQEYEAPGKFLAVALEHTWRMLNNGYGTVTIFHDRDFADTLLRGAEDLLTSVEVGEDQRPVEWQAMSCIGDLIRDGRIRYELSNNPPKPEAYRVEIAAAAAGGAR